MMLAAAARRLGDGRTAALHLERALDTGMTLYAPEPGPGRALLEKALRLARGRQVNPEAYVSALTEALAVAERDGDANNAARAALLLGSFEGRRGGWEAARRYVERGLRLAKQAESPMLIAESHRLLGDASLHGSLYEDARLHYAEAIRRWEELGLSSRAARARLLLLVMMLQLGRTEGMEAHAAALEAALKEGVFTDPAVRTEVEQTLRLADAARRGASAEQRENTE
jgi:tetratricopeptide (TPR) repeat protein